MDITVEGRALLETGLTSCCLGIVEGKIVRIAKTIERAERHLDFSNRLILPAGVDLHVHFRDPGMTNKEDFQTGSMSAAAGGTSFVLDMPNTKPPTRSIEEIEEKISIASRKSYVDFGIAALLDEKTDIGKIIEHATAFKIYLGETTGGLGIAPESFPDLLDKVAAKEITILVHAEHLQPLREMEERELKDHDRRRSEQLELDAARMVCSHKPANARIHLVHVTQEKILSMARDAGIHAEVTPHHLLLDTRAHLGSRGKINPPLRAKSTRARLWKAFVSGLADTLGSDHSPHTIGDKEDDFDAAPSGIPGVETRLPLLLQKVAERRLDLSQLVSCSSTRPAEIIGLRKGRIAEGYDADLIAVDLKQPIKIRADRLHSKCGWTPYEGMEAVFPYSTIIRGEEVVREGEIIGDRSGRLVRLKGRR